MKDILTEIDENQKEIASMRPLEEVELVQLKEYFRIGLTYSSNALEGNSLTETETKIVIEEGITIGGKPLRDHNEVLGHSEAFDLICKLSKSKEITEAAIKNIHRFFYRRIDDDNAGEYRKVKVFITGASRSFPPPADLPILMKKLISSLIKERSSLHPVEFAALVHKDFVNIHPFIDGNGRVARLLMNLVLMQEGYNIAIIPPVLRSEYIESVKNAHKNDKPFIQFIAMRLRETQKDYIRLLK